MAQLLVTAAPALLPVGEDKQTTPKTAPSGVEGVDRYLAAVPEPTRGTLQKIRAAIRAAAPKDATETLSYQIPTFKYKGGLVAYAAFLRHCSFFPRAFLFSAIIFGPPAVDFSRCRATYPCEVEMQSDMLVTETHPEWIMACNVQQRFMRHPRATLEALDYSARCRQMHALGGDCYDFMPLGKHGAAFSIGDASGKGLSAALLISNVQSSLRTAAGFAGDDTAAVLAAVNRQVHACSSPDRYATLFYGVFEARTRILRYVNAGHNPPIVLRCDGSIQWLEKGGAPVGMFASWNYEEGTVRLNPGDWVLAYTDGVIEAVDPSGKEWGLDGLRRAAFEAGARTADEMVQAIFTAMDDFSQARQTDDATVTVLAVG